jgi:hypothetical protein
LLGNVWGNGNGLLLPIGENRAARFCGMVFRRVITPCLMQAAQFVRGQIAPRR